MTSALSLIFVLAAFQAPTEPALPIVGGFQTADVNDTEVKAATDFALHHAPKPVSLKEIVSARQQVVAGMNYSLCLRVKSTKFGFMTHGRLVAAKVYKDLNGTYSLSSWTDVEACN